MLVSECIIKREVVISYFAAIVCDQLSNPENGQVTQPNPAVVGSEATYTCNSGFELNGVTLLYL